MNMIEKINLLMEEKDLKKSDVANGAGVPYTTLDGLFKKGYENAKLPTLKKLALFFGVSMEYLANEEITDKNYGINTFKVISEQEKELLSLFRNATEKGRGMALGVLISNQEEEGEGSKKGA